MSFSNSRVLQCEFLPNISVVRKELTKFKSSIPNDAHVFSPVFYASWEQFDIAWTAYLEQNLLCFRVRSSVTVRAVNKKSR